MDSVYIRRTALALIPTLLMQTTMSLAANTGSAVEAGVAAGSIEQKAVDEIIRRAIVKMGTERHLGSSASEAFSAFAEDLHRYGVGVNDIRAFVSKHGSPDSVAQFEETVAQFTPEMLENMTPEQFGAVAGAGLQALDEELNATGLSWSGCAGFGIGAALVVAAIVIVVIAAGKNKSEAKVRREYDQDRAKYQRQYSQDVRDTETRADNLRIDIERIETKRSDADSEKSYWRGVYDHADTEAEKQEAMDKIFYYEDLIDEYNESIEVKTEQLIYWSDTANVQAEIARLTADYDAQVAASYEDEANRVALVPEYQEQAKKLRYVAGASGVVGLYFGIDGGIDCF